MASAVPARLVAPDRNTDDIAAALEQVQKFAEIFRPEDVDEPILAPAVAHAVHEWLVEINYAEELTAVKVEPRRLALLYGPPGTGKTTLAHHLAARLGLPLIAVQSERIIGKYLGETGSNLGHLFDILKPIERQCVLLLDEFDALGAKRAQERGGGAQNERNQALTVLLRRIEFYRGVGLAATNTKDALDPAMWRRFGLQISVDLPGEVERFAILRKYALPFDLNDARLQPQPAAPAHGRHEADAGVGPAAALRRESPGDGVRARHRVDRAAAGDAAASALVRRRPGTQSDPGHRLAA